MVEENMSQVFRLKNVDETIDYFLEEIKQNKLMSRKHKKVGATLNYVEHFIFSFHNYWIYLNFCFCFFACYSYRNCKFCNRINNFYDNFRS